MRIPFLKKRLKRFDVGVVEASSTSHSTFIPYGDGLKCRRDGRFIETGMRGELYDPDGVELTDRLVPSINI